MLCYHENGHVGLHVCAKFHTQCLKGIIHSHHLRLVAIVYEYICYVTMLCCHDNGNVRLHVCAKFQDRTLYAVLYAHSKGIS